MTHCFTYFQICAKCIQFDSKPSFQQFRIFESEPAMAQIVFNILFIFHSKSFYANHNKTRHNLNLSRIRKNITNFIDS